MTTPSRRVARKRESRRVPALLRVLLLIALLATLGIICFAIKTSVLDLDLWLHLMSGNWIAHHRAFPYTDPFSRTGAGRPWMAYSWIPELALYFAYRLFGLTGIGLYGTFLTMSVASSVLWMTWRLSGRFLLSCILASMSCYAFLFNTMPRPVFLTMILVCITLTLILLANRSGNVRLLYWLPPIFLLWSNSHIQFIYGIAIVGLFVATTVAERAAARFGVLPSWVLSSTLPVGTLLLIFASCIVASLMGPYSFRLYQEAYLYSQSKAMYSLITELQAIDFLSLRHYVQLLLTVAAFFILGWNKTIDLFKLLLLAGVSVIAYRAVRESWFVCVVALACIADSIREKEEQDSRQVVRQIACAFAVAVLGLLLIAHRMNFDQQGLTQAVGKEFPVRAADVIREQKLPGPLYNTFRWGDFLIWYLPEYPVAIDGRADLYGDEIVKQFTKTSWGVDYVKDPYLNESGVVLLQRTVPLVKFLAADPRFELLHKDDISVVFRRR